MIVRLIIITLLLPSSLLAEENDWLGADQYNNSIGVRFGFDNSSGQVLGVDTELVMPYDTLLTVAFNRSSDDGGSEKFESDTFFLALSTDPLAQWYGQISFKRSGNDEVLETEDVQLSIGYFPGDWRFELGVIDREITSYFDPFIIRLGLLNSSSIDIESEGFSFNMDYFGDVWSMAIGGQYMEYQEDLDVLQTSRRLQLLLGQQTVNQMFSLSQWQVDVNTHYQQNANRQFGLGVIRYKAIIGGEFDNTAYATLNQKVSDDITLFAMLARSTTDSITYGELAMYYSW